MTILRAGGGVLSACRRLSSVIAKTTGPSRQIGLSDQRDPNLCEAALNQIGHVTDELRKTVT
jgi:hypothetical protein